MIEREMWNISNIYMCVKERKRKRERERSERERQRIRDREIKKWKEELSKKTIKN